MTYLYVYENTTRDPKTVYVGIADEMTRVWQNHNPEAEVLRDTPGTVILQTVEPFSTRKDAEKAEALAIHLATLAGVTVKALPDIDGHVLEVTEDQSLVCANIAGVANTKVLAPAVLRRDGHVDGKTLEGTMVVTIKAGELDGRPSPYGGTPSASFSERAHKWWYVAEAKRHRIIRLIAVLSGSGGLILGDWDVDPHGSWGPDGDEVPLVNPKIDDPRGVKGKKLHSIRFNAGRVYSPDLAE
jgi:predicted GIY-YIG superfamily endonuclease